MFDKTMRIHEAQMVPIAWREAERLEAWCEDFRGLFGWKVRVADKNSTMVVEVSARKFSYTISALGNYLGCILDDKEDGRSCELSHGDFDFGTFAHIMFDILRWESPLQRAKSL